MDLFWSPAALADLDRLFFCCMIRNKILHIVLLRGGVYLHLSSSET